MNEHTLTQATMLIEQRIGLSAYTQRQIDLPNLLVRLSGGEVGKWLQKLQQSADDAPEWQNLIHALTIGETYFMRDKQHFKVLRDNVLPPIILQRRQQNDLHLNIWCVGCSTGEEAYSIAITLHEFLPDIARWQLNIIAIDLNGRALDAAREGNYRPWSFRRTNETFQRRYFTRLSDTQYQIKPYINEMVNFQLKNALFDAPSLPEFDIIFCRNVMLYFSKPHVETMEQRLYEALTPGGWLFLGEAEALRSARDRWLLHIFPGTPIYQRPAKGVSIGDDNVRYPYREMTSSYVAPSSDTGVKPSLDSLGLAYQKAVEAVQTDRADSAEQHLASVLAEDPRFARAHALLALIFANRQALPEAKSHLDIALKLEPLMANAHYIKALIDLEQGDHTKAMQSLQAALYCDKVHVLAAFTLGNLHAQQGDLPRAYKAWEQAQKALSHFAPDDYISELSDLTASTAELLINEHLERSQGTKPK